MRKRTTSICFLSLTLIGLSACRTDIIPTPATSNQVDSASTSGMSGFYLLNEGNMGSNKCTLDFFDYTSGTYITNIFPSVNPQVVKELGDVGNDLQIYGNRLYAVINCSNMVEVMDVRNARHIGTITIPNCRYLAFADGKGYISSYAGEQTIDPNARLGYVAEFDTATLQITREVTVGYQPEEMTIVAGKLYVANSGGYRVPNYDNRVSVVDLETFTLVQNMDVAINLHRLRQDAHSNIYVTSRGDYNGIGANTYIIDSQTNSVCDSLGFAANNLCICGDSLYAIGVQWNAATGKNDISYTLYDIGKHKKIVGGFITDGSDSRIELPYGIAVNPTTREFIVTDAKNYVTPGTIYYYNADGTLKWEATTGDIPAHIAFVNQPTCIQL
ncbi:MAG: YncE family protein [Paludibacteraceae bacterium]